MKRWFIIPLLFLVIGAIIGTMLRLQFVYPMKLNFGNWLHAHSHLMFLGWVTNVVLLAIIYVWMKEKWDKTFRRLFIFMQVLVAVLMVSFPLSGYGVVSITMLTLHNFSGYLFCFLILRNKPAITDTAFYFIRHALLFFVLSTFGAFAIGPLAANDLQNTIWYHFAIFFYLHFQYNGFFIFAILGLFFHLMESKGIHFRPADVKKIRLLMFYACGPAYLLSIIWSDPGPIVTLLAALAALMQLLAVVIFLKMLRSQWRLMQFPGTVKVLLVSALLSFVLKTVLQVASAVPAIAHLALDIRFFVLAYLHLVMIGMVSFVLFAWLSEIGIIKTPSSLTVFLILFGFILSELFMIITPLRGSMFSIFSFLLFVSSVIMLGGFAFLLPHIKGTFVVNRHEKL